MVQFKFVLTFLPQETFREVKLLLINLPFASSWCRQNDNQQIWRSVLILSLISSLSLFLSLSSGSGVIISSVGLQQLKSQLNYESKQPDFDLNLFWSTCSVYMLNVYLLQLSKNWWWSVLLSSIGPMIPLIFKYIGLMRDTFPDQMTEWTQKIWWTSVKSHRLGEDDWPVECDEDGFLVWGATDLLLQSVPQTDPSSEVCHLVEVWASFLIHLWSEGRKAHLWVNYFDQTLEEQSF